MYKRIFFFFFFFFQHNILKQFEMGSSNERLFSVSWPIASFT
jgi:hypothetical protein